MAIYVFLQLSCPLLGLTNQQYQFGDWELFTALSFRQPELFQNHPEPCKTHTDWQGGCSHPNTNVWGYKYREGLWGGGGVCPSHQNVSAVCFVSSFPSST